MAVENIDISIFISCDEKIELVEPNIMDLEVEDVKFLIVL